MLLFSYFFIFYSGYLTDQFPASIPNKVNIEGDAKAFLDAVGEPLKAHSWEIAQIVQYVIPLWQMSSSDFCKP